jgi:hypothetical protein
MDRTIAKYEERLKSFSEQMVAASENITYGDAERQPLVTLQLETSHYIALIQQARDYHADGKPAEALSSYRSAASLLDKTLIPAANELERINFEALENTYREQSNQVALQLFLIQISGLALIGVLVALQIFLYYRMRRVLNPMLLLATLVAIKKSVSWLRTATMRARSRFAQERSRVSRIGPSASSKRHTLRSTIST